MYSDFLADLLEYGWKNLTNLIQVALVKKVVCFFGQFNSIFCSIALTITLLNNRADDRLNVVPLVVLHDLG